MNSNWWLCFIIVFYVYDSEIHFIYAIPFIFRFLVLIVTLGHPVTVSLFFSQHNGVVSPSTLLIVIFWLFFWFPHCPWVWPLTRIAAYIQTNFLSDHIVAIYPPSEACFWTRPLQWRWHCRWRLILQWHHTSIPSSCCWQPTCKFFSWTIIQWCLADIARRWEHPRDLASTSLWPLKVRFLSTLQPLGERGHGEFVFLPVQLFFFTITVADCYFFLKGFLISHECDLSFGSLLTSELLFWAIILSTYTPPQKSASGLVLCSGYDAVDDDR